MKLQLIVFIWLLLEINATEVRVSPITENEIHFHLQSNLIIDQDTIVSEIKNSKIGNNLGCDVIDTIANEISLVIGMNDIGIQHMRWEFEHTSKLGTLVVYRIEAQVNHYEVNIKSKSLRLEQDIPTFYDVTRQCARTGGRRYGLFGPRSMQCYDYHIVRNPNAEEIAKINQNLMDKLSSTKMIGF